MISYRKLFALLSLRGMKKTDLLNIMTSRTLSRLSKGENINTDTLCKICKYLNCQPGDIIEYIEDSLEKKEHP